MTAPPFRSRQRRYRFRTRRAIAELSHAIREIVGFEGGLRFDTSKPDGMPFKALDSSELQALGWQPSVAFHDALGRTYRWFLSHKTPLVAGT